MEEQHVQVSVKGSSDVSSGTGGTIGVFPKDSKANPILEFHHEPLLNPKTLIRLLELDNVDGEDTTTELGCNISTWHVDRTPSYHAIPCVCGSP